MTFKEEKAYCKLRRLKDNITNTKKGIIVYQANCQKAAVNGLARQLKQKFPTHYQDFLNDNPQLGNILLTRIDDDLWVCAVYGQEDYGKYKLFTQYDKLREGLEKVEDFANKNNLQIYVPRKIGCGYSGGNWCTVMDILYETMPDAIICEWN